ncbi:unnamed protein product [Acanthoscelides obtectus]|uniref:Transposable element P transposase-like RNase H domain-containing protein n=1 Tax=Acanthoscelides obtectus TaxID=200917 RepID=A0A9P0NVL6_ACAOB|nr:unnamed protein product [Acanthoscelides obtectus]CAK1640802.1 hypothetical protein AOBTE_LOCUS11939 [Acanthoscelides obtectus]
MIEKAKCCLVMFDEMYLSCHVHYNRKDDCINGIENGGIVDDANVFMIQGVYSKWKQPVCFTFSSGSAKSGMLKNMLTEVIKKCQEIGLHVVATVCDQASADRTGLESGAVDTAELILFFDKLFDSLNSNTKTAPSSKPLKGGLRKLLNMSDMDISHRNTKFNEVLQNKAFVTVP